VATFDSPAEHDKLKRLFSGLSDDNFGITSQNTTSYNCLAWAVEIDTVRIDPGGGKWPATVPRSETIEALIDAYKTYGFEECADGEPEKGYAKIALYAHPMTNRATHAARQLKNGKWTSKLGDLQDIRHDAPEALNGKDYGSVRQYMRKPVPKSKKR
jgi:hypothetical protein